MFIVVLLYISLLNLFHVISDCLTLCKNYTAIKRTVATAFKSSNSTFVKFLKKSATTTDFSYTIKKLFSKDSNFLFSHLNFTYTCFMTLAILKF